MKTPASILHPRTHARDHRTRTRTRGRSRCDNSILERRCSQIFNSTKLEPPYCSSDTAASQPLWAPSNYFSLCLTIDVKLTARYHSHILGATFPLVSHQRSPPIEGMLGNPRSKTFAMRSLAVRFWTRRSSAAFIIDRKTPSNRKQGRVSYSEIVSRSNIELDIFNFKPYDLLETFFFLG